MIYSTQCCGVKEIAGIERLEPSEVVRCVGEQFFCDDRKGSVFLFSDAGKKRYGEKLAKYIKKNRLGSVTPSKLTRNPNTGNIIRLYLWHVRERMLHHFFNDLENQRAAKCREFYKTLRRGDLITFKRLTKAEPGEAYRVSSIRKTTGSEVAFSSGDFAKTKNSVAILTSSVRGGWSNAITLSELGNYRKLTKDEIEYVSTQPAPEPNAW